MPTGHPSKALPPSSIPPRAAAGSYTQAISPHRPLRSGGARARPDFLYFLFFFLITASAEQRRGRAHRSQIRHELACLPRVRRHREGRAHAGGPRPSPQLSLASTQRASQLARPREAGSALIPLGRPELGEEPAPAHSCAGRRASPAPSLAARTFLSQHLQLLGSSTSQAGSSHPRDKLFPSAHAPKRGAKRGEKRQ